MGCDIHNIVEVKVDGEWIVNPNPIFKNGWYNKNEKNKPKKDQWDFAFEEMLTNPHDGRNYDWFSILADVRNGRGFAGISTGAGFDVIAQPRGIPSDATDEWNETVKEWGIDLHSYSYLYIEDFDKFDWNQLTMKYGVISLVEYKKLKGTNNTPEMWSGSISGGDNITISEEDADGVISGKLTELTRDVDWGNKEEVTLPIKDWSINVEYAWSVLYSEWFEDKIKDIIEPLRELSELYEDARIVFAFDN